MKKFIIKLCKKILCHYDEHVIVTKTVLTYTKLGHEPYLRHDYKCGNCGVSLGMSAENLENVDKPIKEGKVDFWADEVRKIEQTLFDQVEIELGDKNLDMQFEKDKENDKQR